MMKEYNLEIGSGPTKYNPQADPRVSNEFATVFQIWSPSSTVTQVAFRFGHSQVQNEFRPWVDGKLSKIPPQTKDDPPAPHPFWVASNNFYFNPAPFNSNEGGKGWINEVEGLINQKCPEADLRIENVLTNELFNDRGSADGSRKARVGGMVQRGDHLNEFSLSLKYGLYCGMKILSFFYRGEREGQHVFLNPPKILTFEGKFDTSAHV